jgi:hypothetical protein
MSYERQATTGEPLYQKNGNSSPVNEPIRKIECPLFFFEARAVQSDLALCSPLVILGR